MKVYSAVRSERSCTDSSDASALRSRNTGTSSLNPNVDPFLPSSSHSVPLQPSVSYTQAQAAPENSMHLPTQSAQQQQQIVTSNTRLTHSILPSISQDGGHGLGMQGAYGLNLQDGLEGGSIPKLKQN